MYDAIPAVFTGLASFVGGIIILRRDLDNKYIRKSVYEEEVAVIKERLKQCHNDKDGHEKENLELVRKQLHADAQIKSMNERIVSLSGTVETLTAILGRKVNAR